MAEPRRYVKALEGELIALVKSVPAFTESGFSVFDLGDFERQATGYSFPTVGVQYDGSAPNGIAAISAGAPTQSVGIVRLQFSVILAVQYGNTGQEAAKDAAFYLLDDLRETIMGSKGVNKRPWIFVGDGPEPEASGDGLIFYSQVWHTLVPYMGKTNQA